MKNVRITLTHKLGISILALLLGQMITLTYSGNAQEISAKLLIVNGGDLEMNHWATESILLGIDKYKLFAGYPDHKFRGERTITRYELASSLYKLLSQLEKQGYSAGEFVIKGPTTPFDYAFSDNSGLGRYNRKRPFDDYLLEHGGDVDVNHWYTEAIELLTDKYGLFLGYEDGRFRGQRTLTRYEFTMIMAKVMSAFGLDKIGTTSRYEKSLTKNGGDLAPNHWANPGAKLVLSHGIMNLYNHRNLLGDRSMNRYEIAYAFVQLAQVLEQKKQGETVFLEDRIVSTPGKAGRIALVIGNSAYKSAGVLKNPVNDAQEIARTLGQLGFKVIMKNNISTRQAMVSAIRDDFGKELRLSKDKTVLFYYAGHAMQIKGQNYLIPTQADMKTEADKEAQSLSLEILFETLTDAGARTNIVILDSCRSNPFSKASSADARGIRIASNVATQGLANLDNHIIPVGTYIGYATSAGDVASDGTGKNGLYTQELLKALKKKGLKIEDVDKEVRRNVRSISSGKQIPWQSSSLEYDFVFNP